jgi:hypothetical protein
MYNVHEEENAPRHQYTWSKTNLKWTCRGFIPVQQDLPKVSHEKEQILNFSPPMQYWMKLHKLLRNLQISMVKWLERLAQDQRIQYPHVFTGAARIIYDATYTIM